MQLDLNRALNSMWKSDIVFKRDTRRLNICGYRSINYQKKYPQSDRFQYYRSKKFKENIKQAQKYLHQRWPKSSILYLLKIALLSKNY